MAIILEVPRVNQGQRQREVGMGVMGHRDTQQGGFGAKISRHFFFPLLFGKGVIRAAPPAPPPPKLEGFWSFGDQSQPQLMHQGKFFEGWIHISQPTQDVSYL